MIQMGTVSNHKIFKDRGASCAITCLISLTKMVQISTSSMFTDFANEFISFRILYSKMITDFENVKKKEIIFEVGIQYNCLKCEYLVQNEFIHLRSQ